MQYSSAYAHSDRCCKFVVWPTVMWGTPGSLETMKTPSPDFPCSGQSLPWEKQPTVVWESDMLLSPRELAPSFSNRKREQLIAAPMTPPELGSNPTVTGKTEVGWQLTEKAFGEQLWKSEEVHKKPGIINVHRWSDVSYSSTTIFYSADFGQWDISVDKHAHKHQAGRNQNPTNRQNHNIIFYYNLIYLMVWLMSWESSGFAVLPHFSIRSSSMSTT